MQNCSEYDAFICSPAGLFYSGFNFSAISDLRREKTTAAPESDAILRSNVPALPVTAASALSASIPYIPPAAAELVKKVIIATMQSSYTPYMPTPISANKGSAANDLLARRPTLPPRHHSLYMEKGKSVEPHKCEMMEDIYEQIYSMSINRARANGADLFDSCKLNSKSVIKPKYGDPSIAREPW